MVRSDEDWWSNWYYLTIVSLIGYWIYRLINQSKILFTFPLDNPNDVCAYMSHLFFLKVCGFLQSCPYWYNGFTTFTTIPPGWFFIAFPIYHFTGDILFSTWLIWILTWVVALTSVIVLTRFFFKWSLKRSLFFFSIVFCNAMMIGNFIKLMRVHELLSIVVMSIIFLLALGILSKHGKSMPKWIIFFFPLFFFQLFLHPAQVILCGIIFIALFIVLPIEEGKKFVLCLISAVLSASFWLIPYALNFIKTIGTDLPMTASLWDFSLSNLPQNILALFIPIGFLLILLLYLSEVDDKYIGWFCVPFAILALFLLFRVVPLIPFINSVNVDSQLFLLLFLGVFLFTYMFPIEREKWVKKWFVIGVLVVTVLSIFVSEIYTPKFSDYTDLEYDTLDLFNYIDGKYNYISTTQLPKSSYVRAYYSYGPIYHNLTTSQGWGLPNKEYNLLLQEEYDYFKNRDCEGLGQSLLITNTSYLISYGIDDCTFLNKCDKLMEVKTNNNTCLYKLNET